MSLLVTTCACILAQYFGLIVADNSFVSTNFTHREVSGLNNSNELQMYHLNQEPEWVDKTEVCQLIPYILKCSNNVGTSILTAFCATYNRAEDLIEIGRCDYNPTSFDSLSPYKRLPTTKTFNGSNCKEYNRMGSLCGNCQPGFYPLAYSFDTACVECPSAKSNWWKLVLVAFLPLTVFYLTIVLFKISVTSSQLHGFVIYSQGVALPVLAREIFTSAYSAQAPFKIIAVYGVWNLDFFRSLDLGICLDASVLQILAFNFVVGAYPVLLMLLSYLLISLYDRNFRLLVILWKPFRAFFGIFQKSWDVKTSLIDAFITVFVLSYVKLLSSSYEILVPVRVQQVNSRGNVTVHLKVFYNASVSYFGEDHMPYAVVAIFTLFFFILLPTVFFALYPIGWFQKLLNLLPFRWHILHTFMDSLHGYYKDGTQPGTHDCRWFASTFFILRFMLMVIGLTTFSETYLPLSSMALALFTILLVNIDPFKDYQHMVTNTVFILSLAVFYLLLVGIEKSVDRQKNITLGLAEVNMLLPLLYLTALILLWFYKHRKFGLEIIRMLLVRQRGYKILQ